MRMGHPDRDGASEVLARCNTSRASGQAGNRVARNHRLPVTACLFFPIVRFAVSRLPVCRLPVCPTARLPAYPIAKAPPLSERR
jgi:hypothetical protein